jgi:hypothetical protein
MDSEKTPLSDSESGEPEPDTGDHWLYRCFDASGTLLLEIVMVHRDAR